MGNKDKAISLRKQGLSISLIAEQLGVAKSTVSIWVRDVVLSADQKEVLLRRSHLARVVSDKRTQSAINRRQENERIGWKLAETDANFRVLCALYWGEGSKTQWSFGVANCDWQLIAVVYRWLCSNGFRDKLIFNVCYHAENGLKENEIRSYWNDRLPGLQPEQWRKSIVKDTSAFKIKKVGKRPYGTAYIKVNDVSLLNRVMGGIDYLREMAM